MNTPSGTGWLCRRSRTPHGHPERRPGRHPPAPTGCGPPLSEHCVTWRSEVARLQLLRSANWVRRLGDEVISFRKFRGAKKSERAAGVLALNKLCRRYRPRFAGVQCPSALSVRALQLESSVLSANSQGHFSNFVLLVRTKPPSSQWLYPSGGVGRRLCGEPKAAKLGYCVSSTSATCHKKECIDTACRLLARNAR